MAKRTVIGSVCKSKEGSPYLKIRNDVTLKAGSYVNLESPKQQKERVSKAMAEGKLTEQMGTEILARLEKIPAFVLFDAIVTEA